MPNRDIIVIGASAAGISSVNRILTALPLDLDASVFVALDLPAASEGPLPEVLRRGNQWSIAYATDGERIRHRRAYLAPRNHQLLVKPERIRVVRGPRGNRFRPVVDSLFRTAAEHYGPRVIGIALSGALDDSTHGFDLITRHGGIAVAQAPDEATAPGMPLSPVQKVDADHVLRLSEIEARLPGLVAERAAERSPLERWIDSVERVDTASARFRSLWDDATIGYLRFDRSGTIVAVNRVARDLLGISEKARVIGTPLDVFTDRGHAETVRQHISRCRSGETVVVTLMAMGDTGRLVELVSARVFQTDRTIEFHTFLSDLSQRQASEEAVRESEQRYRTIVETANEGICSVDADDRITFVNRQFARMLGGKGPEFVGKEMSSFVHAGDLDLARTAFRYRRFGVAGVMELRLCRLDRSVLWTSVSSSLIADAAGGFGGVLRMFSDISDRKELEAMRARLVKHLVAAQEAERRRIARELHDQAGQHLVGLTLGLDSLAKIAPVESEARRIVTRLQQIAEGLSRDVHHLAVELRPAALDDLGLAAAVGNYADAISDQFGVRVDLHCVVAQRLDPSIETTVYRVVQEALTNVVRHASAQQVSVIIESQPTLLRVVIEDDGVGFDVSRTTHADDPGLGIIGMRERATLIGGELTIESRVGNGTTLFLRVPLPREGPVDHEETARAAGG